MYHQVIAECGVQGDIYDLDSVQLLEVIFETPLLQLVCSSIFVDLAGMEFGRAPIPWFWRVWG